MECNIEIPRDKCLDGSLGILLEGYQYIPKRCKRLKTNIFQTRLMGQKAIIISGEEAAQLFYDNRRFTRRDAMPMRIQKSLFGQNGIQTLYDEIHDHRKKLFMSIMTPDNLEKLSSLTTKQWDYSCKRWERKGQINLFDESQILLFQIICRWTGVPLKKSETRLRAKDLGAMVDSFGGIGPRHWRGRFARDRTELWMQGIIKEVRKGTCKISKHSVLHAFAHFRDANGELLPLQVAAVDLLNIIRPTVAIASYIAFGAVALHVHPEYKEKFQKDATDFSYRFAQEIRRFYPFAPFVGARVRTDFTWNRCHFTQGTLVLLDIYGTNHDPKIWERHDEFWPDHFKSWSGNPYNFIPQGGGDYYKGNRCAGEWVTLEILKRSMEFLATKLAYDVPSQDLSFSLVRMPTTPRSGFVMNNIRRKLP